MKQALQLILITLDTSFLMVSIATRVWEKRSQFFPLIPWEFDINIQTEMHFVTGVWQWRVWLEIKKKLLHWPSQESLNRHFGKKSDTSFRGHLAPKWCWIHKILKYIIEIVNATCFNLHFCLNSTKNWKAVFKPFFLAHLSGRLIGELIV